MHSPAELRKFYEALWRKAQSEGIWLRYEYLRLSAFTLDVGGWFEIPTSPYRENSHGLDENTVRAFIERGERPQIHIVRDAKVPPESVVDTGHEPESAVANLPEELHTLAHEYGHAVSAHRGNRTPELIAATSIENAKWQTDLSEAQRALIFAEEERAWAYGWEALAGLGYRDREAYDKRREESLGHYRARLPLPLRSPTS